MDYTTEQRFNSVMSIFGDVLESLRLLRQQTAILSEAQAKTDKQLMDLRMDMLELRLKIAAVENNNG
jgi:hypothetical protein